MPKFTGINDQSSSVSEYVNPGFINALDYGVVADGTTSVTSAIQAIVTSNRTIFFPRGTYLFTSEVVINSVSDLRLLGEAGTTFLYAGNPAVYNPYSLISVKGTIQNLKVESIRFEVNAIDSTELPTGLLNFDSHAGGLTLNRLTVKDCEFSALNTNVNAISILLVPASSVTDFRFLENRINGIGRMGIEFVNHNNDSIVRYSNIRVENNDIADTGRALTWGCGLSFSGPGQDIIVTCNHFKDLNRDHAVELVHTTNCIVSNNVMNGLGKPFNGIASGYPTGGQVTNLVVSGNVMNIKERSSTVPAHGFSLGYAKDVIIVGNQIKTGGYSELIGCIGTRLSQNIIESKDHFGLWLRSGTTKTRSRFNTISNQDSALNYGTIMCQNLGTTDNKFQDTVYSSDGNNLFTEYDNASGNSFVID